MAPVTRSGGVTASKKTVFLIHGFPNGPIFYKELITELSKEPGVNCVVLDSRHGIGGYRNNYRQMIELFDTYADVEGEKIVIAHDWGAVNMNHILRSTARMIQEKKTVPKHLRFDKVVTMSIPLTLVERNIYSDGLKAGLARCYQVMYGSLYLLTYIPYIGRFLSYQMMRRVPDATDGEYATGYESYWYVNRLGILMAIGAFMPKGLGLITWSALDCLPLKQDGTKFLYFRGEQVDALFNDERSDADMGMLGEVNVIKGNHWFLRNPDHLQFVAGRIRAFLRE
eukprot:Clim_evm1s73 gene=Clim_evmTU1s73